MARFYLLGLGVEPLHHATIEVLQALGRCDVVYSQGLTSEEERYLRRFRPRGLWRRLDLRDSGSNLSGLLARDLKAGRTAAWATRGHPFYWNAIAARLVKTAKKWGADWQTYGAVSPMGLALAETGVALGDEVLGLQSFDISALARKDITVNPEWPLILYSYAELSRRAFSAVLSRLLLVYPADHPVEWRLGVGNSESVALGELSGRYDSLDNVSVLSLPALRRSKSKLGRTSENPMPRTPERVAIR